MSTFAGRAALLSIASYINTNRYSTNPGGVANAPDYDLLYNLLSGPSPIDHNLTLSHEQLTRALAIAKGGRRGFGVHVYSDGVEVPGSPFSTYAAANLFLELAPNSRTVYRHIDHPTKLYRGKYSFRSVS
jgi:hypothetical protein